MAGQGYGMMFAATVLAVITFAIALRMRSWPFWLLAFGITVGALWMGWSFRRAPVDTQTMLAGEAA